MAHKVNKNRSQNRSFNPKSSIQISDYINITIAFLTFLSVVGVFLTLVEMRKDRDAAYKPSILMNPKNFEITWNSNGEEPWAEEFSSANSPEHSYTTQLDGTVNGTIKLPITLFTRGELESFAVVNIGVGSAKQLTFSWDETNIESLTEYLVEYNPNKKNFCSLGKSFSCSINHCIYITDLPEDSALMYMLPESSQTYTLPLPVSYSILIHEIIKSNMGSVSPRIVLKVTYSDIQDKQSEDFFLISIVRTSYTSNKDGSGSATYQLVPTYLGH